MANRGFRIVTGIFAGIRERGDIGFRIESFNSLGHTPLQQTH